MTYYFNQRRINFNSREPETIALSDIVEIQLTWADRCLDCLEAIFACLSCTSGPMRQMEIFRNTTSVFMKIDGAARKIFPTVFLLLNFAYWTTYIYIL